QWTHDAFNVPDDVYVGFNDKISKRGEQLETDWNHLFTNYKKEYHQLAKNLQLAIDGQLPEDWEDQLPAYDETTNEATRATSNTVLNAIAKSVPHLFGGSADLASSNNTMIDEGEDYSQTNYAGRNLWFGV